jgi:hypothetical protein
MSLTISMMCRLNIRLGIAGGSERPPRRPAPRTALLDALREHSTRLIDIPRCRLTGSTRVIANA